MASTRHPAIDARIAEQAEQRALTGGVWSLGHLRLCWIVLVAAGILLVVAAALRSGGRGILGVLVGVVIVGGFFSVSAVIIARVGAKNPKNVMKAALGAYVVKVIALGVVMVLIPRDGPVDAKWMAGTVGIGVFAWLAGHLRYVLTTKILYVDAS